MATSVHPPHDDRIFFKEARSLAKAGAEVVVLCRSGMTLPARADGVRFENHTGRGGLGRRALSVGAMEDAIRAGRYDVIHCHEPDSLVAALRVKRSTGAKVIFDSHESWGGTLAGRFPRPLWGPIERAFQIVERQYLRRCDAAIGASLAISEYLGRSTRGINAVTIFNAPLADVFGEHEDKDWSGPTVLCHEGHLTFDRGLKNIAEATRRLSGKYDVVLRIVGDVFDKEKVWLESFIEKHSLDQIITRTGWLLYEDVGKAIAPCHIGLISLMPLPNNKIAAPNKCFNYLLYGLPVVCPHYPRSHFAVLDREGCAVLADPKSAVSYEQAIAAMLDDRDGLLRMSQEAMALSKAKYRWNHMEPILFDLYEKVLN